MEKRRQAIFYFVAAALFGIVFAGQALRHGLGPKAVIAALITVVLAALGTRLLGEDRGGPRRDGE